MITREMYLKTGRVQGSLARLAEELYENTPEKERQLLRTTLVELADVNERGEFARRRVKLSSLSNIVQDALERYVQARLLVINQGDSDSPQIEVAHEALFRNWPLLNHWLETEGDRLRLRRNIALEATEWEAHDHSQAYLWRDERLVSALDLIDIESLAKDDRCKQFLIASQKLALDEKLIQNRLADARSQLKRLVALREIDFAINSSGDLNVTLDVLLNQVTAQLQVDAASVLLFDRKTNVIEFVAGRGFRSNNLLQSRDQLKKFLVGHASFERNIITVDNFSDTAENIELKKIMNEEEFVTYYAIPLRTEGEIIGVLELFHRSPFNPDSDWLDFLGTMAGQASIAISNAALLGNLQRSNLELSAAYDVTIESWANTIDLRDRETEGHSQRITEMTFKLAQEMGIDEEKLIHIRRGALLHDIGKIGIPDSILFKPGPLTAEEWRLTRAHPINAYNMLSPIINLRPALDIPYCHHEMWDGTGYPRGLKGKEIPISARIFTIVDVWDSLTSDRPYRKAWPKKRALEYIREQAGTKFDPKIVNVFIKYISSLKT